MPSRSFGAFPVSGGSAPTHTGILESVSGATLTNIEGNIGTQYYKGVINIKNIGNGMLLWGVTKTENITQDIYDSYGENPTVTFLRDVSMKSVPQNNDSVKKYSMKRDNQIRPKLVTYDGEHRMRIAS